MSLSRHLLILTLLAALPAAAFGDPAADPVATSSNAPGASTAALERAVSEARSKGDSVAVARSLTSLGEALCYEGYYVAGLEKCRAAVAAVLDPDLIGERARCEVSLGRTLTLLSRYTDAVKHLEMAIQLAQAAGDAERRVEAQMYLYDAHRELGNWNEALNALDDADQFYRTAGDEQHRARIQYNRAVISLLGRRFDEATSQLRTALDQLKSTGDKEGQLWCMRDLIGLELMRGEGSSQYKPCNEAIALAQEIGNSVIEAWLQAYLGEAHYVDRERVLAIEKLELAAKMADELHLPEVKWRAHHALGRLMYRDDLKDATAEHLEIAISTLEENAAFCRHRGICSWLVADRSDVYRARIDLLIVQQRETEAFNYVERDLNRQVLESLRNQRFELPNAEERELLYRARDLQDRVDALRRRLHARLSSALTKRDEIPAVRADLETAEQELRDFLVSLPDNPRIQSLLTVQHLTLPEVKSLVDEETTLVEYFVMDEITLAYTVTSEKTRVDRVKIGKDRLRGLVGRIVSALTDPEASGYKEPAEELFKVMIEPYRSKFFVGQRLVIVPHGPLAHLPFSTLLEKKTGLHLITDFQICNTGSSFLLKLCQMNRRSEYNTLLAMGNPVLKNTQEGVPSVRAEIDAISKTYKDPSVFLGVEASKATFQKKAPTSNVIHLACPGELRVASATHGQILMSDGGGEDGNLEIGDLYELDLGQTTAVVLSAIGADFAYIDRGHDIAVLTHAIMMSGVSAVMGSYWNANGEWAARLMTSVYRTIKRDSKTQSLRIAQANLSYELDHPHQWAGYCVWGDYQ